MILYRIIYVVVNVWLQSARWKNEFGILYKSQNWFLSPLVAYTIYYFKHLFITNSNITYTIRYEKNRIGCPIDYLTFYPMGR